MKMKLLKLFLSGCLFLFITTASWAQSYTDDLCEGGTVYASSSYFAATNAFDDNTSTHWESLGGTGTPGTEIRNGYPEWLKYDFGVGNSETITQYRILTDADDDWTPDDWQFQGSNDNSNWTNLDTKTDQFLALDSWFTYNSFTNTNAYRYYRIYITDAGNSESWTNDYWVDIAEMEMMASQSTTVTFADGSGFTPSVTQGSANQAIGRFLLTGAASGASLTDASIQLNGIRTGMSNIKLWSSTNTTFESGSDTQLGSTVSSDPGNGSSALFSSLSSAINTSSTYYFVTCDVAGGATGVVQGVIVNNSSLTMTGGSLSGTITNAQLSSGDASLPVGLVSFSARPEGSTVTLSWVTESETNNLGFILERSEENVWTQIASYQSHNALKGQGNTSSRTEYSFTDRNVEFGETYSYRLFDVDIKGKMNVHAPVSITLTKLSENLPGVTALEKAYPNPFNPQTYIAYQLAEDTDVNISVLDMLGRQVKTLYAGQQFVGSYHVYWNGTNENDTKAPSGNYIIRMQTKHITQLQKVMLIK
jgi:hypothetical protein